MLTGATVLGLKLQRRRVMVEGLADAVRDLPCRGLAKKKD